MSFQDFLLRAKRPASLVAFNSALPSNFKLIVNPGGGWIERAGVNLDPVTSLTLKDVILGGNGDVLAPAVLSSDVHYNLRVTDAWSGWEGIMIDEGDDDFGDARLNKSKVKQWFKNNGVERLDSTAEHPRSGRADMRWFRWTDRPEWVDITIDEPQHRRRVWL